jgi:hypothetical protein
VNGPSPRGGSELVEEALDHLLEPLDLLQQEFDSRLEPAWDVAGAGDRRGDGLTRAMTTFRIQLRRSKRPLRRVIAWILLGLALMCLTWLMLRVTGPR